nr:hypothetical protein SUGSMm_11120 [Morganella morganii subsp. sibonii]
MQNGTEDNFRYIPITTISVFAGEKRGSVKIVNFCQSAKLKKNLRIPPKKGFSSVFGGYK